MTLCGEQEVLSLHVGLHHPITQRQTPHKSTTYSALVRSWYWHKHFNQRKQHICRFCNLSIEISVIMSSEGQFNILGSSKLNTADGKNPTASGSGTAESKGSAMGQPNSPTQKTASHSAHDAMEDRLREEERLARMFRCFVAFFSGTPRLTHCRLEEGINLKA